MDSTHSFHGISQLSRVDLIFVAQEPAMPQSVDFLGKILNCSGGSFHFFFSLALLSKINIMFGRRGGQPLQRDWDESSDGGASIESSDEGEDDFHQQSQLRERRTSREAFSPPQRPQTSVTSASEPSDLRHKKRIPVWKAKRRTIGRTTKTDPPFRKISRRWRGSARFLYSGVQFFPY